jgi:hypothetical protein
METGVGVISAVADGAGAASGFVGSCHEEFLGETADLGAENGRGTFVPENHVREGDFFLNRKLGGENGFDQLILESATGLEPLDLGGAG